MLPVFVSDNSETYTTVPGVGGTIQSSSIFNTNSIGAVGSRHVHLVVEDDVVRLDVRQRSVYNDLWCSYAFVETDRQAAGTWGASRAAEEGRVETESRVGDFIRHETMEKNRGLQ